MITADQLSRLFGAPASIYAQWVEPLNQTCQRFGITTKQQVAMFLAQIGHESGKLSVTKENLNYSVDGLLRTFPKYFSGSAVAAQYARKPQAIGSRVYANRMGNGDEASGEGFKYRGRGLIQVTGKNNYTACGEALGLDLVKSPELLESALNAALSAGWFWNKNGLNALSGDIVAATKRINGGTNGLEDRKALYQKALAVL